MTPFEVSEKSFVSAIEALTDAIVLYFSSQGR